MSNSDYEWKDLVQADEDNGTPSQELTDQSFKYMVDTLLFLDGIQERVKSYTDASLKERMEQCKNLIFEVGTELKERIVAKGAEEESNPVMEKLEERLAIIKPLVEPPKDIYEAVTYCVSVAKYFEGPCAAMEAQIEYWSEYSVQMGKKIEAILAKITTIVSYLQKSMADIQSEIDGFKPIDATSLSISELKQIKIAKEDAKIKEIKVKRYYE